MKIFLSWSREHSHKIALALRDWLPSVIQTLEPYVSSEDIEKGSLWSTKIAQELQTSSFGIFCITSENIQAPWIHFEAGALSKTIDSSCVIPFLVGVKLSELQGPLSQFQATQYEKEDIRKMVSTINAVCDGGLESQRLDKVFDKWWPELDEQLNKIQEEITSTTVPGPVASHTDKLGDLLEELLSLTREQLRILNAPDKILPIDYMQYILNSIDSARNERNERFYMEVENRLKTAISDLDVARILVSKGDTRETSAVIDKTIFNLDKLIMISRDYLFGDYSKHFSRKMRRPKESSAI